MSLNPSKEVLDYWVEFDVEQTVPDIPDNTGETDTSNDVGEDNGTTS